MTDKRIASPILSREDVQISRIHLHSSLVHKLKDDLESDEITLNYSTLLDLSNLLRIQPDLKDPKQCIDGLLSCEYCGIEFPAEINSMKEESYYEVVERNLRDKAFYYCSVNCVSESLKIIEYDFLAEIKDFIVKSRKEGFPDETIEFMYNINFQEAIDELKEEQEKLKEKEVKKITYKIIDDKTLEVYYPVESYTKGKISNATIDSIFLMDIHCVSQCSSWSEGDIHTERMTINLLEEFTKDLKELEPWTKPPHNSKEIVMNYLKRYTEVTE